MSKLLDLLLPCLESEQSIDDQFITQPNLETTLTATAQHIIREAESGGSDAYEDLIRCLFLLQDEALRNPMDKKLWPHEHPVLYKIRYDFEQVWEKGWISQTELAIDDLPESPQEFAQWLRNYCSNHPVLTHPLLDYLNDGTIDDFRAYFYYGSSFDVPQNDLYAIATVGLPDESARIEISKNYWDEMGLGEQENCHTHWSSRFFAALGIYSEDTTWSEEFLSLPLESIERFMVAQYIGTRRKNWGKLIGHLGSTEIYDPLLNIKLLRLIRKFGISDYDAEYFIQHIKVDAIHSADWLKKVVIPICEESPETRFEIARGAEMNLTALYKTFNSVLKRLKLKIYS